jgi:hypothetical protein
VGVSLPAVNSFIPVAVGSAAVICTILIHALPLSAAVAFVRREKNSAISASTF